MTQKGHCDEPNASGPLDAATILTGFGAHAGARALHNAFVSEIVGDSIAAQFWIEVYRVIAARRP